MGRFYDSARCAIYGRKQTRTEMIYWNTTPGAAYNIAVPNQYGLTPADIEGMELRFEALGNVSRGAFPSGGFTIDAVTPAWIVTHIQNSEVITPDDFPPDGEYTYRAFLSAAGQEVLTLSVGLMVFGNYTADREQYDKVIQYEQYD